MPRRTQRLTFKSKDGGAGQIGYQTEDSGSLWQKLKRRCVSASKSPLNPWVPGGDLALALALAHDSERGAKQSGEKES